jgi:hypothetical protein
MCLGPLRASTQNAMFTQTVRANLPARIFVALLVRVWHPR